MANIRLPVGGLYLMGRLVNREGLACNNSKYFPIPYQTLAIQKPTKTSYENGVRTLVPDSPIAFTDKNGRLNYFSSPDSQKSDNLLLGTPVSVLGSKKALFFPSYLVPMAQASYQGKWLTKLYKKLELNSLQQSIVDVEPKTRTLKMGSFLDPENAVPNNFVADYKKWHSNTFSNLQDGSTIQIIEIPQYYTVVLTFSSVQYVDAKVTMSDFPSEIKISGDLSETNTAATSVIKAVSYDDESNERKEFYAATFWIETELLEVPLSTKQQYSRFDIDLEKADGKTALINHGIPIKYSLSEQVLHLPIQTAAGRTTLVNGDPISVEEALVNHAPQYFTTILNKTYAQVEQGPSNLSIEKKDKTLFDSTWHNLQTYKGFFEASAGMLEGGKSWSVISKTYNAAFGMSGSNSDAPKLLSNILGISGSASGFLDLAKTFKSQPSALKGAEALASVFNIAKYPRVQQMVDNVTDGMSVHLIPDRLRPFVSQHRANANAIGTFAGKLTGTPLSVAELAYNFHTSLKLSDDNVKQNGKLLNITQDYTGCTQSTVEQMSLMSKSEFEEHKSKVTEIREKLKDKLAAYTKSDKNRVRTEVEKIGDLSVQLINVGFDFNNAKLEISEEGQSVLDAIANSLLQLSDPINIKIIGHTCFLGSDEYNMALSLLRAKALKEALMDKLKASENVDIWESRIEPIGRGEKDPLVDNNNLQERYKNRRVEVQFLFSTAFQYPPCRSGISAIESQRRATVASSVKEDAAWLNTASGAFDIALGIGAGFLGPIGVSAYALWWSNNMLQTGMDVLNQAVNNNYNHYANLKKYSEFGVVTQSMLVNNDPDGNNASFIKKAYLKRALALNGLFRLIHRYHYEPKFRASNKYKSHSDSGLVSEFLKAPDGGEQQVFIDYDFEGYIKYFLLNDSWEIAHDYLPVYLDEVWLQELNKKVKKDTKVNDFASIQSYISGAVYLKNKLLQNEANEEHLQMAQRFQSLFPIHYLSSQNFDYFNKLFVDNKLSFDDDIFEEIVISVRKRGSESKNDWKPLDSYLKTSDHHSLSPYDQIRILVVLDHNETNFEELLKQDTPLMIPVSAQPVRRNILFDDVGNTSTEYVTKLKLNDLCNFEQKSIEASKIDVDKIYGVIIQPKFMLGANIVPGTRPMADYNDSTLESLFLDEKHDDKKAKHKGASGHFAMNYYYQLSIPGTKINTKISYGTSTYRKHKRKKFNFSLTLDPERKYQVKKKSINGTTAIEVKDDHLLYEENFLKPENVNSITCPQVFDNPRVEFSLYQGAKPLKPVAGKEEIKFDWNSEAEILAVIYTKSLGTKHLVAQHTDTDIFPVSVNLLSKSMWEKSDDEYNINLAQASGIHRIGTIKTQSNKTYFEMTSVDENERNEYKWLKDSFSVKNENMLSRLQQRESEGAFESREVVDTDVFAVKIPLSYINAAGKKVKGLKPMPSLKPFFVSYNTGVASNPNESNKVEPIYLALSLSSNKGAGLKNKKSNRIIIDKSGDFANGKNIPSNWFYHTDVDRDNGLATIKTNADENKNPHQKIAATGKLKHSSSYALSHSRTKLTDWIKAGEHNNTTSLSVDRIRILKEWIKGE